jgi:uncharacterized protein (DUF1684 family)
MIRPAKSARRLGDFSSGLTGHSPAARPADTTASYLDSIKAWQEHRNAGLRKPDSWLTLVGLFWLSPGDNTIGSAAANQFVLPKGSAPEHVGILHLEGDKITFQPADQSPARLLAYDGDTPDMVQAGSVSFFIIKRGDRFAVRAKDSQSPTLKHFTGLTFFPVKPALHFEARFIPDARKIPILSVLGTTDLEESPGIVEFTYEGKKQHLRPIYEGNSLFFLFKDLTNKELTYQAGRMLNTPLPADGKVDLDFNRSYNPPCTFTPYATCPLPPKENHLPFAVDAGEKRYGKGHAELPST